MKIRRYTKADIPVMVKYLEQGLQGFHYREISFHAGKVTDLLVGNLRNPSFFCDVIEEDDGDIGGALAAHMVEYMTSREVYAEDLITYIREGHRSLAAITGLVARYKVWAKSRDARQIRWGQSTGYKMDKFAVLAKRMGFSQIGTKWSLET